MTLSFSELIIVAGLMAAIGCVLQGCFIGVEHAKKYVGAVVLKGAASLVFCFIGLYALMLINEGVVPMFEPAPNKFQIVKLVIWGLCLGALGDILLNLRFVFEKIGQKIFLAGIAAFLVGHIVYLVSLIKLSQSVLICSICGVVIAAILLTIIFKSFTLKIAFKIFGVLYIGAVCLMASFAVGNYICLPSVYTLMYAIGAVLFLVSDVVLIFNTFGPTQKFGLRITNLTLYYFGQLLIASSLFYLFA